MRAQIRELIRPATLLAAVLVFAAPSPAGLRQDFEAHSNQEGQQVAHTNQETTVGYSALRGAPTSAAAALFAEVEAGVGFKVPGACPAWIELRMPDDAPAPGPAAAEGGLGVGVAPAGDRRPGGLGAAGRPVAGAVPAPGGLGLLVLAALAGRGGRRRRGAGGA